MEAAVQPTHTTWRLKLLIRLVTHSLAGMGRTEVQTGPLVWSELSFGSDCKLKFGLYELRFGLD